MYKASSYPYHAIGPVQFIWQAKIEPRPQAKIEPRPQAKIEPRPQAKIEPHPQAKIDSHPQAKIESCPQEESSERITQTRLWIFCHPAINQEVLSEVQKTVETFNGKNPISESEKEGESSGLAVGLVSVRSLKDELVRFRLIGPRSHALLMETLKPVFDFGIHEPESPTGEEMSTSKKPPTDLSDIPELPQWWRNCSDLMEHARALASCYPNLKSASSPAEFSRGTVIGMTVLDPRFFTPSKKTDMVSAYYPKRKGDDLRFKQCEEYGSDGEDSHSDDDSMDDLSDDCLEEGSDVDEDEPEVETEAQAPMNTSISNSLIPLPNLPQEVSYSPIWNEHIRQIISKSKIPEHLLNKVRSQQFLKSSEITLGEKSSRIPILLIHQSFQMQATPSISEAPGSKQPASIYKSSSSDIGTGFDLVLPSNWAMSFWIALIYRGARACGTRELRKCSLEALVPHFPEDYPDTLAGQGYSKAERRALEERFQRYPPDKRRNYGKLLIASPFHCPWEEIVQKWSNGSQLNQFLPQDLLPEPAKCPMVEGTGETSSQSPSSSGQEGSSLGVSMSEQDIQPKPAKRVKLDGEDEKATTPSLSQILTQEPPSELKPSSLAAPPTNHIPTFYVLRSRSTLAAMNQFSSYLFTLKHQAELSPIQLSSLLQRTIKEYGIDKYLQEHVSALIPIRFEMHGRGTVTDRAMICVPTASDLTSLAKDKTFQGPEEVINPKGITVVDKDGSVHIGLTLLSWKELKDVKKLRKTATKSNQGMSSYCRFIHKCSVYNIH